jgi:ATP-dependent DNA helicase RecQ
MLLSTVLRLGKERNQKFGAGQAIDILLGKQTEKVVQHKHESLSVFGIGTDLSKAEWGGVVRQLLAQGLLAVEGDYGTLVLTAESRSVLSRERKVMLRRDVMVARAAAARGKPALAADLPAAAAPIFERLRGWRAATAKELGVPAYVIFHDSTLRQIATDAPSTLAALSRVSGVGEAKLAKFGQQILDALRQTPEGADPGQ